MSSLASFPYPKLLRLFQSTLNKPTIALEKPTVRIVCANCHLAAKPTQVEVPQAVLPDTVFEAVVKIPYDTDAQQVLGSGDLGPLNVGAVLMLPDGFQIAPDDRIPEKMKEEINGVFYQKYKPDTDNVIVVGPLSGADHQEIIFPVLSPDPATDPNIHFGKYSVHAGGNRGRGQIYPTGDKTNVNAVTSPAAGLVSSVSENSVTITTNDGQTVTESIPAGLEVVVSEGQAVADGAPSVLTPTWVVLVKKIPKLCCRVALGLSG